MNHTVTSRSWIRVLFAAVPLALAMCALSVAAVDVPVAQAQSQRPWLGVVMAVSKQGVLVKDVVPTSPASKAGVQVNDVITSVDGTPVYAPREVSSAVGSRRPGQVVRLQLLRGTQSMTFQVKLGVMPTREEMLRLQRAGRPAPAWVGLKPVTGTTAPTVASYKGRVLLVDFWASWCQACRASVPQLNAWSSQYGSKGLAIVGIASEAADVAGQGVRNFGIRYTAAADPDTLTTDAYNVSDMPSLIIVDRKGVVRDVATGYDPVRNKEIEALIVKLLAEAP